MVVSMWFSGTDFCIKAQTSMNTAICPKVLCVTLAAITGSYSICKITGMDCSLVVFSGNAYVVLVFFHGGNNRDFLLFTLVVPFLTHYL